MRPNGFGCSVGEQGHQNVKHGASELLVHVFGERGIHARSAVSVAQVPFGACVEIDMIAELRSTQVGGSR
jgi:enamine deaminase RidA (YjgF/YER057c/UK114 family)